jgi:tripartite-type tricarboxylate transporter receptor subunit TctC
MKKSLLLGSMFCLALELLSLHIGAQTAYPSKTVELILPYAAGGGVDAMARAFAREAAKVTNSTWIVTNKDGAAGLVGFSALANASPDGYTLVFSPASPLVVAPFLSKSMPFELNKIQPVCQVFENVFSIAVRNESPIKSFADLIKLAKESPGKLNYGHAGTGSVPHLSVGTIEKTLGVQFNAIPYRGDGQLLPQLLGGDIDFAAPALSSIAGRNLRVLAVLSSEKQPGSPDAPTITQLGVGSVTPGLNGIYATAGTPQAIVEKLQDICAKVTHEEEFKKTATTMAQTPAYLNTQAFNQRLAEVSKTNSDIVKTMKLEKN